MTFAPPSAPPPEEGEYEQQYPQLNQNGNIPGQTTNDDIPPGYTPGDNLDKSALQEYKINTDSNINNNGSPMPAYAPPEEEVYEMAEGLSNIVDYQILFDIQLQPEGQITDPQSMKSTDIPSFIPIASIVDHDDNILSLCENIKNSLGLFKSKSKKKAAFTEAILRTCKADRQEMNAVYSDMYKTSLDRVIKRTFKGVFRELLLYLMMSNNEFLVKWIDVAFRQKDVNLLSLILCTQSNENLHAIKEQYKEQHTNTSLSKKVDKATTNWGIHKRNINTLLMKIVNGSRANDSLMVDRNLVLNDVQILLNSNPKKKKVDKNAYISIFTERSFQHLSMMAVEYANTQQKSQTLLQMLDMSFKGSSETGNACKIILHFCTRRYELFSSLLQKCVRQPGPNYAMFLRMIVERCDIDLENIIQVYGGAKLHQWINGRFAKDEPTRNILNKICGF